MKRILALLLVFSSLSVFSQVDSVIVHGTTGMRVEGKARVRNLPEDGTSFQPVFNVTASPYKGSGTLVADDKGMIGVIQGVTITELEDINFVEHVSVIKIPFDPPDPASVSDVIGIDSIEVRMGSTRGSGVEFGNGWMDVDYLCNGCCYNRRRRRWEDCIRQRREYGVIWTESPAERILEFRIKESNHWGAYLQKRGRPSTRTRVSPSGAIRAGGRLNSTEPDYYRQQFGSNEVNASSGWTDWIRLDAIAPNPLLDDLYEVTVALYNSRKAYRIVAVSTKGFDAIPARGLTAVDPYFHIFIEKLD